MTHRKGQYEKRDDDFNNKLSKVAKRCHKCDRLRHAEFMKEGPLRPSGTRTVRKWECAGGCAPHDDTRYRAARAPERYEGADPPRRRLKGKLKAPPRGPNFKKKTKRVKLPKLLPWLLEERKKRGDT